ncbi:MAG: nucleoside deaminase [Hyphomonadaceae bacterium]|nr:nucleoside deaminase [Hyphomonadaceae bacterium]
MTTIEDPMRRALALARRAAELGEVPVGAVIVDPATGEIIAEAHNQPIADHDPTAHAEVRAIRLAAAKLGNYRLPGLHLYVTLEPCAMCAGAISFARLAKLVFAADDPKGGAVLYGPKFFDQPTCHWRPEIEQDLAHATEAGDLLTTFFKARRSKRTD